MSLQHKSFIHVATPTVGEEEADAVRKVLLSGNYVSGEKVADFERLFAEYIGTRYAVAVNSGTAALHIALEALGVGRGDEVIVPPLTFFATISAVLYLGARPVFADINLDDLCLSPQSVLEVISDKTRAILPVHLFGCPARMNQLMDIGSKHGIAVIEDCAQAHGSESKGRKVGSIGQAGAFSFFATKHMTTGEGGMITTDNLDITEQCRCIRNHGMNGRDDHVRLGFNNRMTEMEAAMGIVQLGKLDDFNGQRIENSEKILAEVKRLSWAHVPVPENTHHTYFWCPVMVKAESGKTISELMKFLQKNRIGFRHRYDAPLYRQPVLQKYGHDYAALSLPNVEQIAGNVIGLPNHPGMTSDDVMRLIKVMQVF